MEKILYLIILMSAVVIFTVLTPSLAQPSYCQEFFGDNICDDSQQDCGTAYIEPADPESPASGSIPECNECQTGGYDCDKSLPKEGPDSSLCKAYYGDNICDDTKEKCSNDYKIDEDGKPISVASCQECSTGGFVCPDIITSFKEKYTTEPDERRLTGYMSKEKIREAVASNIKKVTITDLNGKEEIVDVQIFADSLANTSFNFLSIKKLVASFNHPESGKCVETMERVDLDPPRKFDYPPYMLQATGFFSTIKCEKEWKETQIKWSNAAPLESFFTWVNKPNGRSHNDLIFDKDGRQLVFKDLSKAPQETGYLIDPPKTIKKGPESSLCQTFGSSSDPFCDDTEENCASGYVEGISEPSCQECSTGKWTNCVIK